jgi:hypothetical protein
MKTIRTYQVYLIIIVIITLSEMVEVQNQLSIYLGSRFLVFLLALGAFLLAQRKTKNTHEFLFIVSLMIYNCVGHLFRPQYIPSFIHSMVAISLLLDLSKIKYWIYTTGFTVLFITTLIASQNHLPYNFGDAQITDLIFIPIISWAICGLIYTFYASEKNKNEVSFFKFSFIGKLSARAIHDIKSSLALPSWIINDIKSDISNQSLESAQKKLSSLNSQIQEINSYLISLNSLAIQNDKDFRNFKVSEFKEDILKILYSRLKNCKIEVDSEINYYGSASLFKSILINLVTNSLNYGESHQIEIDKISIFSQNNNLIYTDHILHDSRILDELSSNKGDGLRLIKEALTIFNLNLDFKLENNQLFFIVY